MTTKEEEEEDDDDDIDIECRERCEAELEFVTSAYPEAEIIRGCFGDDVDNDDNDDGVILIRRRIQLHSSSSSSESSFLEVCFDLSLPPSGYPLKIPLEVNIKLDQNANKSSDTHSIRLQKAALNAIPTLLSKCREISKENVGEESIFVVLNALDEWIQDEWPQYLHCKNTLFQDEIITNQRQQEDEEVTQQQPQNKQVILGRRLIYSHHIISKKKRSDIKHLASEYQLTGCMKIGWPGLLIIEGHDDDCNSFYDTIRPWSWQYLVVRGEQQENIVVARSSPSSSIDPFRRFQGFIEVDDMSIVAEECRKVGLEDLFRTSMKVYYSTNCNDQDNEKSSSKKNSGVASGSLPETGFFYYGCLVHVDHMNDGKSYRKWLRKTKHDVGCYLFMKQYHPNGDYTNRPKIYVGIVGETKDDVSTFMKRWRTGRVDVDSKGKPCLERQMTVLVEGEIMNSFGSLDKMLDWEKAVSEEKFTITEEQMKSTLNTFGWTSFL
jgi:hypothetical protein